jgi:hypothetical protein
VSGNAPHRIGRPLRSALRHPAAILLVVIAGLLPLRAWTATGADELVVDDAADGLDSITWTATVAPDGRLAVRIHYALTDEPRVMDIRLPPGARYLALDGRPLAADIGRYATARIDGAATVSYELVGRVHRYRDGVLVVVAGSSDDASLAADGTADQTLDGDHAMFACPRCFIDPVGYGDVPVFGALYSTGASAATLWFSGLDGARVDNPPDAVGDERAAGAPADAVSFLGIDRGADDVSMVAVLPPDAAPDVARSDGDVATALQQFRARMPAADDRFVRATPADVDPDRTSAVVLTIMFGCLLGALVVGRRQAAGDRRRRRAARSVAARSTVETPRPSGSGVPGDLAPGLVGLVVDDTGSDRSAVAATILELARRGVISIAGTDNRRFAITIPPGAAGANPFEQAVLTQMRPNGTEPSPPRESIVTGPPVWHQRAPVARAALVRALLREGRRAKLIRPNRALFATAALVLAMGCHAVFIADIDDAGLTLLGWLAIVIGPFAALAVVRRGGIVLTARGRQERDRWTPYAVWLQSDPDLHDANAPDVAILGETLVYGAALGAAPATARALSPDAGATR